MTARGRTLLVLLLAAVVALCYVTIKSGLDVARRCDSLACVPGGHRSPLTSLSSPAWWPVLRCQSMAGFEVSTEACSKGGRIVTDDTTALLRVGLRGVEPRTSRVSGVRVSNLSVGKITT